MVVYFLSKKGLLKRYAKIAIPRCIISEQKVKNKPHRRSPKTFRYFHRSNKRPSPVDCWLRFLRAVLRHASPAQEVMTINVGKYQRSPVSLYLAILISSKHVLNLIKSTVVCKSIRIAFGKLCSS